MIISTHTYPTAMLRIKYTIFFKYKTCLFTTFHPGANPHVKNQQIAYCLKVHMGFTEVWTIWRDPCTSSILQNRPNVLTKQQNSLQGGSYHFNSEHSSCWLLSHIYLLVLLFSLHQTALKCSPSSFYCCWDDITSPKGSEIIWSNLKSDAALLHHLVIRPL